MLWWRIKTFTMNARVGEYNDLIEKRIMRDFKECIKMGCGNKLSL